jgi:hypothetical protein
MKSIEEFSAPGIVVLTKEQKEQMIADVMDDFDFDKVHDVMKALGWEWIARTGDGEVPGVWSIAKRAKKLLDEVMVYYGDKEHHAISTGGFTAMLEEDGTLSLLFVLEQKSAYPDDYQVNNEGND